MIYELILKPSQKDSGPLEILIDLLLGAGISPEIIIQVTLKGKEHLCLYSQSKKEHLNLKRVVDSLQLKKVLLVDHHLVKSDWQDKWKKDFKAFNLSKRFCVVPRWDKKSFESKTREPIYIDTSLAFGTGLHETTQFMSELIEKYEGKYASFLDLGTGTGILSIIASKCNAQEIKAMDISSDAINMAKVNLQENKIKDVELVCSDLRNFKEKKQYDFVAANLITGDLIDFQKKIFTFVKPGKYLAVSGISLENEKKIRKTFQSYDMRCLKIVRGSAWLAILYKKG
ncbi:Ribosomal protein L11 methyltransferase [hydrothermal vent metagenome]|uniref:Ribosomal protein L11 methyltransferase n=1 Tax=hydrothermal vent metagenome TaxID=652676 RepID=A0A3B0T492_9ZZZZ